MKVYHLHQKQVLPLTIQEAWEFFSSPKNLVTITPDHMDFKILYISGEGSKMYPGQIISYRVKLFPFVTVRWVTEITHVQEPYYFIDDQRTGPYAIWHHQHRFRQVPAGTEMTDEITYAIPFGMIGRLANYLFVEKQLKTIFRFRYNILEKSFAKNQFTTTQTA